MSHGHIRVVGWAEFQHYKDRDPPWIKLHRRLLDNYEWGCLPDASKAHLNGIWLLAARHHNEIPNDPVWIGNRISASEPVNLQVLVAAGFIEIAGSMLASPKHLPLLETETEGEAERETETENTAKAAPAARVENPIGQVMVAIRKHLYIPDGKPPRDWSERRDASIVAERLKEGTPVGEILDAIEGLALLRDSGEIDWLKRGHKATMKALYHTASGAVPVWTLALNAIHRHAPVRKAKSQPRAMGDVVGPILDKMQGAA